ncbi:MAG: hypothetical protein ACI8WT_004281 [Clostridium sp.]|jgi:hypothetical protein
MGNVAAVLSMGASLLSIFMFFLSKNEKNKCIEIKNEVNQKIEILNKTSTMNSKDNFDIKKVQTFDNSKSMR